MITTYRHDLIFACAALLPFLLVSAGCQGGDSSAERRLPESRKAQVTDNGVHIKFPLENAGLARIRSVPVTKGTATIPVITPARVVASIAAGLSSQDKIILFDYPDVTSLYSQYRQGQANTERTAKNLERIKDMYANQAATARDLNEAETEATNARASMAESEAKLRALGFNPTEFGSVTTATAWLMSDVPESQLHEVQKGEDVDIVFSSFPDVKIHGRAEAIGEVVDPVTRTVRVRVSTPNREGRILPGMFARIDFGDPVGGVFVLPNAAVVTVEGADYVFVQADSSAFERRRVTVGSSGTSEIVVTKGLEEGDRVVVDGAMLLKGLSFGY